MTPDEFRTELKALLDECRFEEVGGLINQMDLGAFDQDQALQVLALIRRKRLFPALEQAAGLFVLAGNRSPTVRRQWAQALLDQDRVDQGLTALSSLEAEIAGDPEEGPEVRGLIGRAYKQRFVSEGRREDLLRAVEAYRAEWLADPSGNRWHGINLVALLDRAEREGVDPGVDDDGKLVARTILGDIEALDDPGLWDYGTAMEAAVALGDQDTALRWAKEYTTHPRSDAFELGSTVRQMKEVWQLEESDLGKALLPVLEYELLQREGAHLEVMTEIADDAGFQAVYGSEGVVHVEWMETMFQRCLAIARVFDPSTGERWGTGFLVDGESLNPGWAGRVVFVTNSHVVSEDPANQSPLGPREGSAEFTRLPGRPKIEIGDLLFTSSRLELDVSILEIAAPDGAEPLQPTIYSPALPTGDEKQRIYVIGHPEGGELAVSLYDNSLAEYEGAYVRYRSPTKGGSSGSPVFNRKWQTFALHHRTREEVQLNEGVLFEAIKGATTGLQE